MKKCKITVLRKTFQKDLAEEYGIDGLTTCPMLQEGQVFYADWECPEGFCNEAWKAIYQYVLHWLTVLVKMENFSITEIG